MQRTRRRPALMFTLVLAASGLTVASCSDDDPAEPLDTPAPAGDVEPTVQPQGDGVPLEPGSNLPPSGSTPEELPDPSTGPSPTG